jgi:hypothetical protein
MLGLIWLSVWTANCDSQVWGFREQRSINVLYFYSNTVNQLWYSEQHTPIPWILHNIRLDNAVFTYSIEGSWVICKPFLQFSTHFFITVVNRIPPVFTYFSTGVLCLFYPRRMRKMTEISWVCEVVLPMTWDLEVFKRRAAAELRLRPRGQQDRQFLQYTAILQFHWIKDKPTEVC